MRAGGGGEEGARYLPPVPCPCFSLSVPAGIINFCANNYLGLSSHPEVIRAAVEALEKFGAGLSSVRFICGTQVPGSIPFTAGLSQGVHADSPLGTPTRQACTVLSYTWPGEEKSLPSPHSPKIWKYANLNCYNT